MSEQTELEQYRAAEARNLVNTALADALAGYSLTEGSPEQVGQLVRHELRVVDDNGRKVVVGPGYQPVKEVIAARLARADHAHFLRGASGSSSPAAAGSLPPGGTGPGGKPATLQEAIRMHVAEQQAPGRDGPVHGYRAMPMQPKKE